MHIYRKHYRRVLALVTTFAWVLSATPGSGLITAALAVEPLLVDQSSHIVVMEYEAWFGPHAVTFPAPSISPRPLLKSSDMIAVGGGYDSADPAVIEHHVALMRSMGVDAAIVELTNNVSCIFDIGAKALDPKRLNPCGQTSAALNRQFQQSMQRIRDNDSNIYALWSRLGTSLKIIPMLACQDNGCLTPYRETGAETGFGSDPCPAIPGEAVGSLKGTPGLAATTSFEKEMAFYGSLMARYPGLNVIYQGKPLVLIFVAPPIDDGACMMNALQNMLKTTGLTSRYNFRMVGGYFDTDRTFWNERDGYTPTAPIPLKPGFGAIWWSWVDRLNPRFGDYPSYNPSPFPGRAENFTASIATAGQNGWGSWPAECPPAPAYDPPLTSCIPGTDYYVDSSLRFRNGNDYATLSGFMAEAARLDPIFLILHQFNEFATPDEGWDANTTDDIEPADDKIGGSAVQAIRDQISRYRVGKSQCSIQSAQRADYACPASSDSMATSIPNR